MRIDVVSIFPDMLDQALRWGVLGRARESGSIDLHSHDLRDFTTDRHRVTDEPPYGGGPGMVMKPEPFFRAVDQCRGQSPTQRPRVILMSPQGRRLTQRRCEEFAREEHLIVLCPRYEGVDERVRIGPVTDEVSIGDYILSGGEIPALVLIDAVARLVPGVLGEPQSAREDSFSDGLLEGPQYTRPRTYRNLQVPEILLSGDHAKIDRWRQAQAQCRTRGRRPDLLA